MDRKELYDQLASRKSKPKDFEPYAGDNGRVNKCAQLIRSGKLRSGGVLLDIGGGIGDLGYAVHDLFDLGVVLDISYQNLEAAFAKGSRTILADVDTCGIPLQECDLYPGSVTLVTALDFIEHIVDPENFARECHRVLAHGGQVFVNTPNIRFWRHIQQLLVAGCFPHTSGDREVFHGGHLAFFTYLDLCQIFGSAGFANFEMHHDDECYEEPPEHVVRWTGQTPDRQLMMELGCPNLLFSCRKP